MSYAQGEHSRRAGAELRVLLGDVRKLEAFEVAATDPLLQQGLEDRVRGSLAGMDILMRMADQELGRNSSSYSVLVKRSLAHTDAGRWRELGELWAGFEDSFPLAGLAYKQSEVLLQAGHDLHQQHCAGCHDRPVQNVQRPAYNLYLDSKAMSADEFFARMLVGVRGDRVTGIDNPLSDEQIAALIYLYESGSP